MPEIEAIATSKLVELEAQGLNVVPTANATRLTMNREGIRRLASEELSLPTSLIGLLITTKILSQRSSSSAFLAYVNQL